MKNNIDYYFNPNNIAVVGASNNPSKAGCVIVKNLIDIDYEKKIFPINKNEDEILGIKAYKSILDIEETIELLVLITPSSLIYQIMDDLEKRMEDKKDVKAIICAAAGYAEMKTKEGIDRQETLLKVAAKHGIRVMGPNCIGVIDNKNRVDTTFVETLMPKESKGKPGGISFISQSGAIAASILMMGATLPVPLKYNKFISVGNMSDVDFIDLLEYLEEDEDTRVIGLYMEGYEDAKQLIRVMGRISMKKPIVVLKVGRTEKGAAAANSHTGSLAGQDRVYDAAFRQFGIIRVNDIYELMDTLRAFDMLPLPDGNQVFLYSQAGGPGIFCMDKLNDYDDIVLPKIEDQTKDALISVLPKMANVCNPEGYSDISAAANVTQHIEGIKLVMEDKNVDLSVFITVVPTFLPRQELGIAIRDFYLKDSKNKPLFICVMAGKYVEETRTIIEEANIPTFDTPDRAALAAHNMIKYALFLKGRK